MLELLHSSRLWSQVSRVRGNGPVVAAVAYANEDHLRLRAKDILICDASDDRIASGATSHALLSKLASRRVQLWHLDKLHAKVIRTSDHVVVGSANMTANSRTLVEAAILTDDPNALRQVDAMLQGLLMSSKLRRIDAAFLRRIESIPVKPGGGGGRRQQREHQQANDRASIAWLIGYSYFTERQQAKAMEIASAATGKDELPEFIQATPKEAARFGRVQPGDKIFLVNREEKRVRPAVNVNGVIQVGDRVFHFHEDLQPRGVAWPRVQAKLKEMGVYRGAGIPARLALSADAAALVEGMFRRRRG